MIDVLVTHNTATRVNLSGTADTVPRSRFVHFRFVGFLAEDHGLGKALVVLSLFLTPRVSELHAIKYRDLPVHNEKWECQPQSVSNKLKNSVRLCCSKSQLCARIPESACWHVREL